MTNQHVSAQLVIGSKPMSAWTKFWLLVILGMCFPVVLPVLVVYLVIRILFAPEQRRT